MIVTDQYEPMVGGVPTVTRELARGLAERGHAVAVIAPSPDRRGSRARQADEPRAGAEASGALSPGLPAGAPVPADPMSAGPVLAGSVRWPWYEGQRLGILPPGRAGALVSRFAPDVVHIHSPLTLGVAARTAARRRRVPVLYTNHYQPLNVWPGAATRSGGVLPRGLGDAAFYAYVTGFANRCDFVTAPTMTALGLLRERGLRAPSQPMSNGVDLDSYAPAARDEAVRARYGLPAGRPVILSVGRLSPEKRADVLIGALARTAGSTGDGGPVLVLAGAGPDEARLRSLAGHYGVARRVLFPGFIPDADLPALYRLADVFAIASEAELQSLVMMAALASGLPVVAVDAGALRELVHPGENGFLARPGRADQVAASLDLLCADQPLRARMGKASLRIISDHDRHSLLVRWESLYREIASHSGSSRKEEQAKVSDGQP
jgi:glycosyltransferase involved in cell wall biosynthesis